MKSRMISLLVMFGCWALAPAAQAEDATVPQEVDRGCAAVAEGISFLTGYTLGQSFGDFGAALGVHLSTKYGPTVLSQKCKNYYKSLEKQKDRFDYARFVETVCGGNPMTCPNGWNTMGNLPGGPMDCHMYEVCNIALAVRSDASLTVQDMLNAGAFIDLSYRARYWDFGNFGYLVGVSGINLSKDVY